MASFSVASLLAQSTSTVFGRALLNLANATGLLGLLAPWLGYYPEVYGAVGDGVHDDTAAIQAALDAAQAADGKLRLAGRTYRLTSALSISGAGSIEGVGSKAVYGSVMSNVEAVNIPVTTPYIKGSVLLVDAANTNGINITACGASVDLRNFGIRFADKFHTTGRGIYVNPPAVTGGFQDSGIMGSTWERLTVFGHDGDHYAFDVTNPLNCTFSDLAAFGGGGLRINTNGQIGRNNYLGNVSVIAPYMMTMVPGSGHAYQVDAVNGETILLTFLRPQAWVKDVRDSGLVSVLPTSSQRTFNVVPPTTQAPFGGGSSWLTIIAPDFETDVSGVTYSIPDAAGICLLPGLINDYSSGVNTSVEDVRLGTLKLRGGIMSLGAGGPSGDNSGDARFSRNSTVGLLRLGADGNGFLFRSGDTLYAGPTLNLPPKSAPATPSSGATTYASSADSQLHVLDSSGLDTPLVSAAVLADWTASTTTASKTFGSIPQGYTHLRLVAIARVTGGASDILCQVNGVTSATYERQYMIGGNAGNTTQAGLSVAVGNGSDATTGDFGTADFLLRFYSSTTAYKYGSAHITYYNSGTISQEYTCSRWAGTSAVTSLVILPASGSFAAGTRFILYGVR